jgi:hypothetical protein
MAVIASGVASWAIMLCPVAATRPSKRMTTTRERAKRRMMILPVVFESYAPLQASGLIGSREEEPT